MGKSFLGDEQAFYADGYDAGIHGGAAIVQHGTVQQQQAYHEGHQKGQAERMERSAKAAAVGVIDTPPFIVDEKRPDDVVDIFHDSDVKGDTIERALAAGDRYGAAKAAANIMDAGATTTYNPVTNEVTLSRPRTLEDRVREQIHAQSRMIDTICVDFDGTVVTHEYPVIGQEVPAAVIVLRELVKNGVRIILWTMRSGKELDDAVAWFAEREIPLFGVNNNPEQIEWTKSPKAYGQLYIDDAALGCPLTLNPFGRPYVDWFAVERILTAKGLL
jgi:hypothetical protein